MIWKLAVALAAVVAITVGLLESRGADDGLHITHAAVSETPVTIRKVENG